MEISKPIPVSFEHCMAYPFALHGSSDSQVAQFIGDREDNIEFHLVDPPLPAADSQFEIVEVEVDAVKIHHNVANLSDGYLSVSYGVTTYYS